MKWIVTGGAGFIGWHAAAYLRERGHECVLADNFHRHRRDGVDFLDVRDAGAVNAFWAEHADAGAVLHLAGQVSLVASIAEPRYDFETNARGTFNALEATRDYTPEACFIYASTNKVYGDLAALRVEETATRYTLPDFPRGIGEEPALDLHGAYSCSKGAADQYVRDYRRVYGLKTICLRQSSIYGGGQFATEDQGWVAYFAHMGARGLPFRISGTGKQVRDLLHVSDLCACFEMAAGLPESSAAFGEAFNVGGGAGNSLSLLELFDLLRESYGFKMRYTAGPARVGDQKVFIADGEKAGRLLGWEAKMGIEEGLKDLVNFTRGASAGAT